MSDSQTPNTDKAINEAVQNLCDSMVKPSPKDVNSYIETAKLIVDTHLNENYEAYLQDETFNDTNEIPKSKEDFVPIYTEMICHIIQCKHSDVWYS